VNRLKTLNKEIKGQLFVISAPSGAGKSSLISDLISKGNTLELSISATTRSARTGEENAKHYFFIEDSEFDALKSKGAFIENACVHGHQYGTLKSYIEERLNNGINIILDIDVQGFMQIKEAGVSNISIFIIPPSLSELEERLIKRNLDSKEVIETRLNNAKDELSYAKEFDFIILNDEYDMALKNLSNIVLERKLDTIDNKKNSKILIDLLS
jgi:guanylate kinase